MDNYKIVQNAEPETVTKEVNRLLDEGWRLHGDLHVSAWSTSQHYTQALVRGRVAKDDSDATT